MKTIYISTIFIISIFYYSITIAFPLKYSPFDELNKTGEINHFVFIKSIPIENNADDYIIYKIAYTKWTPSPDKFNGNIIIYNHGFQSHMAWFNSTAELLVKEGFIVYAFDRVGSGLSTGFRTTELITADDNNYIEEPISPWYGHVNNWRLFTQILNSVINNVNNEINDEYSDYKIHLWANSYGAKIITAYLMQNLSGKKHISSTVFTTPGLFSNIPISPFFLIKYFNASPTDYLESPIKEKKDDRGAHWFTSIDKWFQRIKTDERSQRYFTKNFLQQTNKMDKFIKENTDKLNNNKRLYLMVRDDPMMNNKKIEKHIKSSKIGAEKPLFYNGGHDHRHFLMFTSSNHKAIKDIINYLKTGSIKSEN